MKCLLNYKYNIAYVILIILLNTLFVYVPLMQIVNIEISPMDWTVGIVYVLRDFAQRELEHKVIFTMFAGSLISYVLASKVIAIASMSAFLIAVRRESPLILWAAHSALISLHGIPQTFSVYVLKKVLNRRLPKRLETHCSRVSSCLKRDSLAYK